MVARERTRARTRSQTLTWAVALIGVLVASGCGEGGSGGSDPTSTTSAPADATTTAVDTSAPTVAPGPVVVESTPSTAAPTSAPIAPAVERVDWGNQTYDAACGIVETIELVDGTFRPDAFNSDVERLVVSLVAAEPIATRIDDVLVQLSCEAGGPGSALSNELYFVFTVGPDAAVQQRLVVVGEPDAVHVINDEGVVVIDDTTYGANDPLCCPSVERSRQIVWDGDTPTVVEGARPDANPIGSVPPDGACVATELEVGSTESGQVALLEDALVAAGFDPGPRDGVLDDAVINAVVRVIEFNADNPAIASPPDAPYENLHAEASVHGVVRTPVLTVLGIACDTVAELPRR